MSLLDWIGLGPKARAYIVVRGQVYEGGFNLFAERAARARGAKGWMKLTERAMNSYIEFDVEGSRSGLEKLLTDLRTGPRNAQISKVEVEWRDYKGKFTDFRQRH